MQRAPAFESTGRLSDEPTIGCATKSRDHCELVSNIDMTFSYFFLRDLVATHSLRTHARQLLARRSVVEPCYVTGRTHTSRSNVSFAYLQKPIFLATSFFQVNRSKNSSRRRLFSDTNRDFPLPRKNKTPVGVAVTLKLLNLQS